MTGHDQAGHPAGILTSDFAAAAPTLPERTGRVIALNGPSSSGKTSIALALRALVQGSWYVMSLDAFHARRDDSRVSATEEGAVLASACLGFHRAVAAMVLARRDMFLYAMTRG